MGSALTTTVLAGVRGGTSASYGNPANGVGGKLSVYDGCRDATHQDLDVEEDLREGLLRSPYPFRKARVDLVDVFPRRLEVKHQHTRVVAALGNAVKVSLEEAPRHVKLGRYVHDTLELGQPDNGDGAPSRKGSSANAAGSDIAARRLPVRMSTRRNATVECVVGIARDYIPAPTLHCFEDGLDAVEVDPLGQKVAELGAVVYDPDPVDLVVERGLLDRQERRQLKVDLLVRAQWLWPGCVVMVGSWWPRAGSVSLDQVCKRSSDFVSVGQVVDVSDCVLAGFTFTASIFPGRKLAGALYEEGPKKGSQDDS